MPAGDNDCDEAQAVGESSSGAGDKKRVGCHAHGSAWACPGSLIRRHAFRCPFMSWQDSRIGAKALPRPNSALNPKTCPRRAVGHGTQRSSICRTGESQRDQCPPRRPSAIRSLDELPRPRRVLRGARSRRCPDSVQRAPMAEGSPRELTESHFSRIVFENAHVTLLPFSSPIWKRKTRRKSNCPQPSHNLAEAGSLPALPSRGVDPLGRARARSLLAAQAPIWQSGKATVFDSSTPWARSDRGDQPLGSAEPRLFRQQPLKGFSDRPSLMIHAGSGTGRR
jgi:hypothetical protein